MNIMKRTVLLALIFLLSWPLLAQAQQGTIRGTVYDAATGETMYGVTVLIKGTQNGAISDFDGKFQITTAPGVYTVQASFISFNTLEISGVTVDEGKVTLLDNLQLQEAVTELETFVIAAEMSKVTEAALLTIKKKSNYLIDGISSTNFKRIGDGDAAAASQRVPGVSVEGGKYVYVRGLGDRYTKSILNGMDLPGLDPDRNTLQMDIFPTNILDNIIVIKSFTPELGADFTGGIVNLETKDFPDEPVFSISGSLGYNPAMHLNTNYLTYNGSKTDFLGYDNGLRDIPTGDRTDIPFLANAFGNVAAAADYTNILKSFNPELAAIKDRSFMNYSFGLSKGDQKAIGDKTIGYNFALSYKSDVDYYENAQFNRFGKSADPNVTDLDVRESQIGNYGVSNVLIGGIAGIALKSDASKYKINLLHLQNGESKAGVFDFIGSDQGSDFTAFQHNLEYNQRSLTNLLLNGSHYLQDGKWEIDWKISPTKSSIKDPDIRFTRIKNDAGLSVSTESGLPERIWRTLEEDNIASKLDFIYKMPTALSEAKLRFGTAHTYKDRSFNVRSFQFNAGSNPISANPNDFLDPENLWTRESTGGVNFTPTFIPRNTNQYDANVNMIAGYVSAEFAPSEKLKAIVGVRAENYVQKYTGEDQTGDFVFDNETVLDDLNFFPSINLVYSLVENQNLRFSYSKTIARPSLKEASFANILDPLTGRTFIGGFFPDVDVTTNQVIWDGNLRSTDINNLDIRWETFQPGGQTISVSAFYKTFNNPIEIVQYVQTVNNFQPRNVGDGSLLGLELELRKNLSFASESLQDFSINGNVTVIDSKIDMNPTEFQSRKDNARTGENIDGTRQMAGQAPYIVNFGITYEGLDNFVNAALFYNVQGQTLQFVGIADRPDVYTVPFNSLNFNISKSFGDDQRMNFGFKVTNLLDDKREFTQQSFGSTDQIFSTLSPGRTFSISFSYNLL
jgi:hypothetical protein